MDLIDQTNTNSQETQTLQALSWKIFLYVLAMLFGLQLLIAVNSVLTSYWGSIVERNSNPNFHFTHWLHAFSITEFAWLIVVPVLSWLVADLRCTWWTLLPRVAAVLATILFIRMFVINPIDNMIVFATIRDPVLLTYWESLRSVLASFLDAPWFGGFYFLSSSVIHLVYLLGIGFAVRYWIQMQHKTQLMVQLKRNLAELKYDALCSRLQPHFLFNSLNTISALSLTDPQAVRDVVGRLGSLLKVSLNAVDQPEIELQREYELVADYLEIQKARFGERLQFDLQIEPSLSNTLIPAFLLQPLVENSVKHGLQQNTDDDEQPTHIQVISRRTDGTIQISVVDNGVELNPDQQTLSENFGLKLTRSRLKQIYHDRADIQMAANPARGFTVDITLPYKPATE